MIDFYINDNNTVTMYTDPNTPQGEYLVSMNLSDSSATSGPNVTSYWFNVIVEGLTLDPYLDGYLPREVQLDPTKRDMNSYTTPEAVNPNGTNSMIYFEWYNERDDGLHIF